MRSCLASVIEAASDLSLIRFTSRPFDVAIRLRVIDA